MTTSKTTGTRSDEALAFDRLHALIARGYEPYFATKQEDVDFSSLELRHPKRKGRNAPPPLTLWSNGLISTTALLWPQQHVPSSSGTPIWQKLIEPSDRACFERFIGEVSRPTVYDRYFSSAFQKAQGVAYAACVAASVVGLLPLANKLWPLVAAHSA